MGYQTDFIGYLHVDPPLNEAEIAWVNATTLCMIEEDRSGLRHVGDAEASRLELAAGAPPGWSNWAACPKGCCLSYDGGDKANHMVPWLKHLMATYLVPGAQASEKFGFEDFTCDHFLNSMVVGSRRDNRELYSITVEENDVTVELLWPGVPEWSDYEPLAYQVAIDKFREWRTAYRREQAREAARQLRAEAQSGVFPLD
jgi:hypothetical protein